MTPVRIRQPGFDVPMAYDAATGQLVLSDSVKGGTWTWDGHSGGAASPSSGPSVRRNAVMALDASIKQLIRVGGLHGNSPLNDTWSWTESAWVKLSLAASPSATVQASLAFDAVTGQLVLFGGAKYVAGNAAPSADTWSWTGTTWTRLHPVPSPSARWARRWPITRPPHNSCCSATQAGSNSATRGTGQPARGQRSIRRPPDGS